MERDYLEHYLRDFKWTGYDIYRLVNKAITVGNIEKMEEGIIDGIDYVKIIKHNQIFRFNSPITKSEFLRKYKVKGTFIKYYKNLILILPISVALETLEK